MYEESRKGEPRRPGRPKRGARGQLGATTMLPYGVIEQINTLIRDRRPAPFIYRELDLATFGVRIETLRKHAQRYRARCGLPKAARGRNPTLGAEKRLSEAMVELLRAMKGVRAARLPRVLGAAMQRTFEHRKYPGVYRALGDYRNPFATNETRLAAAIVELVRAAAGVRTHRVPFAMGLALRELTGDRMVRDVGEALEKFLVRGRALARDAAGGDGA